MPSRYIAAPPSARLTFAEDSPLHGLEVTVRTRLGVADLVRVTQAWQNQEPEEIESVSESIGRYLVAWNYEEPVVDADGLPLHDDQGEPLSRVLPANEEGWAAVDGVTKMLVFQAWIAQVTELSGTATTALPFASPTPSLNGDTKVAQLVTTEAS